MADIKLTDISIPGLSHSDYGDRIDEQFSNIDRNFKIIAGTDFLKGNKGDSMQVLDVILDPTNNNSLGLYLNGVDISPRKLYDSIKYAILDGISLEDKILLKSIKNKYNEEVCWDDGFSTFNKIVLIYKTDETTSKREIVSSLYYTFYDARFNNIMYSNANDYADIIDMSCVVCLQSESNGRGGSTLVFKKLNSFPTLYYNEGVRDSNDNLGTFCWIINGNKTEIPATGPRGKTGKDAGVYLAKVKESSITNKCFITKIFKPDEVNPGKFISLEEFLSDDPAFDENVCILAIKENHLPNSSPSDPNYNFENKVWISPLHIEHTPAGTTNYVVYCDNSNSVIGLFNTDLLKKAMTSIYESSNLYGLFVPITEENSDNTQAGHMAYAMKMPGALEGNSGYKHLCVAPVTNIHDKPVNDTYKVDGKLPESLIGESIISFLYDKIIAGHNLEVVNELNTPTANINQLNVTNISSEENIQVHSDVIFNKNISSNGTFEIMAENSADEITKVISIKNVITENAENESGYSENESDYSVIVNGNSSFNGDLIVTDKLYASNLTTDNLVANDVNLEDANITNNINIGRNISAQGDLSCNDIRTNTITSRGDVSLCNNSFIVGDEKVCSTYPTEVQGENNAIIYTNANKTVDEIWSQKIQSGGNLGQYEIIGNINPGVSNAATNGKNLDNSFYELWLNPLSSLGSSWSQGLGSDDKENSFTISASKSIPITKNSYYVEYLKNASSVKVIFNKDISVLFAVSGRNLYSDPWLAGKMWTKPKWTSAKMKATINITYNDGSNTSTNIIDLKDYSPNIFIFNVVDTKGNQKLYKAKNSTAVDKGYGQTAVGVLSVTPQKQEYVLATNNLENITNITLDVDVELGFSRNLTNAEDWANYKVWKNVKILGILSSQRSTNGSVESKIIKTTSSLESKPVVDLDSSAAKTAFDSLIIPSSVDDIVYEVLDNRDKKIVDLFEISAFVKSLKSTIKETHICSDGIVCMSSQSSGFAIRCTDSAPIISAISEGDLNGQLVRKVVVMNLFNLIEKCGGGVSTLI